MVTPNMEIIPQLLQITINLKKTNWEVYITYINGDGRYTDWNYHYYDYTRSEAERKAKDEIKYYDSRARNIDVIYVKEMH